MEAVIENGFARVESGEWLASPSQPVAYSGTVQAKGLRGFIVPDRAALRFVASSGGMLCAAAERPFLTRLDALPTDGDAPSAPLCVVSGKILLAPFASRKGARLMRPVPMTVRPSYPVTEFSGGWVVAATRSRVLRFVVGEGETFAVRTDALVAWSGNAPTGFCPKVGFLDMLLPRAPRNLQFHFHGPCVVWLEGTAENAVRRVFPRGGAMYA